MKLKIGQIAVLLSTLALLMAGCGAATQAPEGAANTEIGFARNNDGYADISVEQLGELLENKDFTLVNTHIPYEGELPQTDLFIPYNEITGYLDQLPEKDAPIVLYCRSGSMSTSAAKALVEQGYTNVLELDGGFNAWKAIGYDFIDKR